MAAALGVLFLDAHENELAPGGGALFGLSRIDARALDRRLRRAEILGATDVDNVLTGPSGASAVFGPQKGADPQQVLLLDRALGHMAAIVHRDMGVSPLDAPGSGAAGGLGFGLLAFCGARLRPGIEVVMQACGFHARLEAADLVITGEGSLDPQSMRGKVPAGVMQEAQILGVPVAILCGRAEVSPSGATVVSLVDRVGEHAAMKDARGSLTIVAEELAIRAGDLAPGAA